MDKKLQSILSIYGEPNLSDSELNAADTLANPKPGDAYSPPSPESEETRDRELRRISEAKSLLDLRAPVRPDIAVIDAVVQQASTARGGAPAGRLRLIKGLGTRVYPLRFAAAASVVLVAVVLGITRLGGVSEVNMQADELDDLSAAKKELLAEESTSSAFRTENELGEEKMSPPAPVQTEGQVSGRRALREAEAPAAFADNRLDSKDALGAVLASSSDADGIASQDSVPGWDEPSDVRLLQRRVESLRRANADLGWDQPAVPLEQFVRVAPQPGVVRARAKKQN